MCGAGLPEQAGPGQALLSAQCAGAAGPYRPPLPGGAGTAARAAAFLRPALGDGGLGKWAAATYSFCNRSIAASSVASFLAKHSRAMRCPAGAVS